MTSIRARHHIGAGSCATFIVGLTLVCGLTSARWISTSFPGFFVLENQVIASIGLPHWPITQDSSLYQGVIVSADGEPIASSEALYTYVRTLPEGSFVQYAIQKNGATVRVTLPTLIFTLRDYILIIWYVSL